MNTFLKKILMVLASMKSIGDFIPNSKPETYCQKLKREKEEDEQKEQKPQSGSFIY